MTQADEHLAAARLITAFDLHEAGVDMMRQTLRRDHPEFTAEKLDELLTHWLRKRPGAEFGDAQGRPGTWPRGSADP